MKRILDEDDLLSIQDTIQREIEENSFDDNYATSDRQGGAAISTKVNNATSGNFKVLLTDDSVDTHGGKQLYQDTALTYNADTKKIDINVTHADTANYFSEAKKIELSGDVTGSALSTGESGWDINTSLKKIIDETAAGPNNVLYGNTIDIPYIEVDEKGRVKSLINKQFTVPGSTLEDFGDGVKNYGWNGDTKNENIGTNNEGETFNSQLSWGSTIKVPNFHVDEKGRVQSGWTSKYTLPAAPDTPDIPNIDKVKLTDDVTGEGTFSNGICTISTKLQANPVKGIDITGAVKGTGTETNGNWTVNTQLVPNQWILESQIFTTGDSPENFIINQDISKNILISCFFVIGNVNKIENGINTYGISDNFNIIIPVQRLTSLKTLEYNIKLPLVKVSNNGTKIDLIGNSGALITFSYDTTSKKMTIQFPGSVSGHFKVQGLL